MTEPNFIILIDLDSRKTDLQNYILKITKNTDFKSKKKSSGPFVNTFKFSKNYIKPL